MNQKLLLMVAAVVGTIAAALTAGIVTPIEIDLADIGSWDVTEYAELAGVAAIVAAGVFGKRTIDELETVEQVVLVVPAVALAAIYADVGMVADLIVDYEPYTGLVLVILTFGAVFVTTRESPVVDRD